MKTLNQIRYKKFIFLLLIVILAACQPNNNLSNDAAPPIVTIQPTNMDIPESEMTNEPSAEVTSTTETTPLETNPTEADDPALSDVTEIPDPANFTWVEIASGFVQPLDFADAGEGIFYIVEQNGLIHVLQNGNKLSQPFLDIQDRVGKQANEQGLLGLAFNADYTQNRTFYLNYTDRQGNTVIARYQAAADGLTADPDSEEVLLQVQQPYGNHNGGDLEFGPDNFLYIGLGDGGSGGDPENRAQNPNTLLGKLLRIDVNGMETYAIPENNPYVNGGGEQEIFAIGLRNPWRFTFDQINGDLYIADVGQGNWEEINYMEGIVPGVNYGWDFREGSHAFEGEPPPELVLIDPVLEYGHDQGCSVTGGYVYRGLALPQLYGVYLYGDYCSGTVWGALKTSQGDWQSVEMFSTNENISSFGQDKQGEIYLISHSGRIYKLQASGN